jgi:hypothetical protein
MVDRVSASIVIGGNLPAIHLPTFTGLIIDQGLSLEWDGEPFVPSQCTSGSPLALMAEEVAWGRFDALETFCIEQGLAFCRWCAGCHAWGAQRAVFIGQGKVRLFPVDEGDDVLIDRATVMELGNVEAIIAYLDAADFAVPPLLIVGAPEDGEAVDKDTARSTGSGDPAAFCAVRVAACFPLEALESEDRTVPGLYALALEQADIDRRWREDNPSVEAAKDIFHASVAIANLDHFEIDFDIIENAAQVADDAQWLNGNPSGLPKPSD